MWIMILRYGIALLFGGGSAMLRIIRSIHMGEIVTLTVVASLVLIFGLSTNAWAETTTRAAKCRSLLFNEVSGWFCEKSNHCRSKDACIPPSGLGVKVKLTKDLEIKVRNRGNGNVNSGIAVAPLGRLGVSRTFLSLTASVSIFRTSSLTACRLRVVFLHPCPFGQWIGGVQNVSRNHP